MFGYIVANQEDLTDEEKKIYQAFYCGVCHSLGSDFGAYCRSTLSFDMTFLAIVLQSLEPDPALQDAERCAVHPAKKHSYLKGDCLDYAAAMNIALIWQKCQDDWQDDHNVVRYGGTKLYRKAYQQVQKKWPHQCDALADGLAEIAKMEVRGETNPDLPTAVFGKIMGELFVMDQKAPEAEALRHFGTAIGRLIYIMDAVMDLKEDLKKERYNPLIAMEQLEPVELLSMLLAACVEAWKALPARRNQAIVENILYSGVWIQFNRAHPEKGKGEKRE